MIARRTGLALGATLSVLAWSGALRAQARPAVVIAWLSTSNPEGDLSLRRAFAEGMAAVGLNAGEHYRLEERHAAGHAQQLPTLAQELAARKPAVFVAWPSSAAKAATAAAPTTPVVQIGGDPVASGLVKNLAQPDGMVTGLSNMSGETIQKVFELLIESVPKLQRVGVLLDPTNANRRGSEATAHRLSEQFRVEGVIASVARPDDIEPAMARLAKARVQALVLLPSSWFNAHVPAIMRAAQAQRWPVVGTLPHIPRQGGLLSFSPDAAAAARRAAHFVDRLLKGAKPADLPIERPTTFSLVLNLKTARQLGIVLPQSVLIQATDVIE